MKGGFGILASLLLVLSAAPGEQEKSAPEGKHVLKVMTLNLAHGRGRGLLKIFQKRDAARKNLDVNAAVLRREAPHVVALQEADGPSLWSGNFDHVKYLAEKAGFSHSLRGEHVKKMKLAYGTALLSLLPLRSGVCHTFASSALSPSKGFLMSTITWPALSSRQIDVVSVHLDFMRKSVRKKQIKEMVTLLGKRKNARIVMGDFNCEWAESTLSPLQNELKLKAFQPEAEGMETFPLRKKRFDWIFISPEFRFQRYQILKDPASDHHGVAAEITLAGKRESPARNVHKPVTGFLQIPANRLPFQKTGGPREGRGKENITIQKESLPCG